MAESKRSSSFTDIGYTPQTNEQERMMSAADRVEACLINNKPKRVHLSKIEWQPANRGWHGILPMHAHAIAHDIRSHSGDMHAAVQEREFDRGAGTLIFAMPIN